MRVILFPLLCWFLALAVIWPVDLYSFQGFQFLVFTGVLVYLILSRLWIKLFPDSKRAKEEREEARREARRKER